MWSARNISISGKSNFSPPSSDESNSSLSRCSDHILRVNHRPILPDISYYSTVGKADLFAAARCQRPNVHGNPSCASSGWSKSSLWRCSDHILRVNHRPILSDISYSTVGKADLFAAAQCPRPNVHGNPSCASSGWSNSSLWRCSGHIARCEFRSTPRPWAQCLQWKRYEREQ